MAVLDDCILVDNRLAVPVQRPALLKRIHEAQPEQDAIIGVSRYLWWPHMHKNFVNLSEECRSCTRCGKKANSLNPKKNHQNLCDCLRSAVSNSKYVTQVQCEIVTENLYAIFFSDNITSSLCFIVCNVLFTKPRPLLSPSE